VLGCWNQREIVSKGTRPARNCSSSLLEHHEAEVLVRAAPSGDFYLCLVSFDLGPVEFGNDCLGMLGRNIYK
jgi:hypothetical protein